MVYLDEKTKNGQTGNFNKETVAHTISVDRSIISEPQRLLIQLQQYSYWQKVLFFSGVPAVMANYSLISDTFECVRLEASGTGERVLERSEEFISVTNE